MGHPPTKPVAPLVAPAIDRPVVGLDHPLPLTQHGPQSAQPVPGLRAARVRVEVPFEPEMLEYDRFDHGRYRVGLGDWTDKIRSGVIHPAIPAPEDVPEGLHDLCQAWGYG